MTESPVSFDFDRDAMTEALTAVPLFAGKDALLPLFTLTHVHGIAGDPYVTIFATDRFTLARYKVPVDSPLPADVRVLLAPPAIKIIVQTIKSHARFSRKLPMTVENGRVTVGHDGATVTAATVEDDWSGPIRAVTGLIFDGQLDREPHDALLVPRIAFTTDQLVRFAKVGGKGAVMHILPSEGNKAHVVRIGEHFRALIMPNRADLPG